MLRKVWFEDAWEWALQSYLDSISKEILCSSKKVSFLEFVKNPPDFRTIFANFSAKEIKNQSWSWIPKNLGTLLVNFYRNSQKSPGDP